MMAPRMEEVLGNEKGVSMVKVVFSMLVSLSHLLTSHPSPQVHNGKFPDLKNKFKIEYIPAVIGFRNGKEMNRMVGVKNTKVIKEFVKMLKESQ